MPPHCCPPLTSSKRQRVTGPENWRVRAEMSLNHGGLWPTVSAHLMIQVLRVVQMLRQRILGAGIILGAILVLSLVATGVMQHPASAQGSGTGLLWMDIALLVIYGFVGVIVWKQRSPSAITAAIVGAQIGLVVGAVLIANHLIEAFVPARPFALIISPVLLTLALLGAAGAAAWERTGSLVPAVISGVCCAIVATVITLCFAIYLGSVFEYRLTSICSAIRRELLRRWQPARDAFDCAPLSRRMQNIRCISWFLRTVT